MKNTQRVIFVGHYQFFFKFLKSDKTQLRSFGFARSNMSKIKACLFTKQARYR